MRVERLRRRKVWYARVEATTEIRKESNFFCKIWIGKLQKKNVYSGNDGWRRRRYNSVHSPSAATTFLVHSATELSLRSMLLHTYEWARKRLCLGMWKSCVSFSLSLSLATRMKLNSWMYERDVIDKMNYVHKLRIHSFSFSFLLSAQCSPHTPTIHSLPLFFASKSLMLVIS